LKQICVAYFQVLSVNCVARTKGCNEKISQIYD